MTLLRLLLLLLDLLSNLDTSAAEATPQTLYEDDYGMTVHTEKNQNRRRKRKTTISHQNNKIENKNFCNLP
jgi:hypothetical protein